MKSAIFAVVAFLSTFTGSAQTTKDFFVPTPPNNKATFYKPSKTGGRTDMTRILFYADKGTTYEITDVMMYSGNPTAISTMTVTFNGNEVAMTKSVTTNIRETNKQRIHNPATILFKLPPAEGTVSWSSDDTVGDKIKYTASWTVTNVDGKELKTIMVEKEVEGFGHVSIEYYVQGIGLYKTDLKSSDGKLQAFESFDELIHDPTVK